MCQPNLLDTMLPVNIHEEILQLKKDKIVREKQWTSCEFIYKTDWPPQGKIFKEAEIMKNYHGFLKFPTFELSHFVAYLLFVHSL